MRIGTKLVTRSQLVDLVYSAEGRFSEISVIYRIWCGAARIELESRKGRILYRCNPWSDFPYFILVPKGVDSLYLFQFVWKLIVSCSLYHFIFGAFVLCLCIILATGAICVIFSICVAGGGILSSLVPDTPFR